MRIYRCNTCGNILVTLDDKQMVPMCCSRPMELLKAKTEDELSEKHVPNVTEIENRVTVTVGDTLHPMDKEHYIQWVLLETNQGFKVSYLHPGDMPRAQFIMNEDEIPKGAYAYCNVHGLWMKEIHKPVSITMEEAFCYSCQIP